MERGINRRATNKLSDKKVAAFIKACAAGKKLSDGGGLFVTITKAGNPCWRLKYRFAGKERLFSIGNVSLASARAEREAAKDVLRAGRDPVTDRRLRKAKAIIASADTFEALARVWLVKQPWSKVHREKSERALERDIFPRLGNLPVADIETSMVTMCIEGIADRGAIDTAGKVLQHVEAIFRLAQARGLRTDNPATPSRAAIPRKATAERRRPAALKWAELGDILRAAESARLSPAVRLAHRLCAFTAARISNIAQAEWREFELDAEPALWVIPRKKMKAQGRHHDHKIILGDTITAQLRAWRSTIGGKGFVFPSPAGGKHITRESLEKAYRVTLELEGKHTPHGWRAAFSTLARDDGFERDAVELTLDHIHDKDIVRAYDRGERWQQRIALMAWWDKKLTEAQRGADVVPLHKRV